MASNVEWLHGESASRQFGWYRTKASPSKNGTAQAHHMGISYNRTCQGLWLVIAPTGIRSRTKNLSCSACSNPSDKSAPKATSFFALLTKMLGSVFVLRQPHWLRSAAALPFSLGKHSICQMVLARFIPNDGSEFRAFLSNG